MATSFALSSSDNRAFREAIDAVSRVVDEAVIQPTSSGLRIAVADASNVVSVDTTVPFAAFDISSAFSGDPFGVDVDALSSTFGNINKTSGVTIEDGSGDTFTVTDDSTGTTTEFQMIDTDEMRNVPDLEGTVGEMDYDTTVNVPRNQFRRLVRAAGSVGDYVGVGVAPEDGNGGDMAFKMVCEGDTDTFTGAPDFNFTSATPPRESATGLYTHKYLDSVSLGTPDRGIDVEFGFEGDDFPLRVRFNTGGDAPATVTYYIAPRISSESGTGAAEVKSADVTGRPVPSPDFVAGLSGRDADTFVNALSVIADERRVVFTREGVESRAVGPGNHVLDIIEAEPGFFDTYREVGGFSPDPIGIQTQRLSQYYSVWLARQELTLSYDSDVRFLGLEHPIFSIQMATIDPDSMRQEPNLPAINFTANAEVDQSGLQTAIRNVTTSTKKDEQKPIGLVVTTDGANSGVYLTNEDGGREKVGGGGRIQGNGLGLYSNDYMRQIASTLMSMSSLPATIRLGNSFPFTMQATNSNDTFRVTTSVAPRVMDGKQEVLNSDPIADGMSGSGVDLSFFTDDSDEGAGVGFFDNVEEESAAERARKQKYQTYPVTVEVSTSYSGRSITIENQDDLGVADSAIERLREEVGEFVEETNIGSRETVGEVTFTSDTEYEIEYADVQPDTDRRIIAGDGHAFRITGTDENNYLYYSRRDETPARFQISVRAVEDDGTFGVKIGHKVPKETEIRGEKWVIEGAGDILTAYEEAVGFIQDRSIEEIVEAAEVDVELSTKESESELNEIRETYRDYTLEVSPNEFDDSFYAALNANAPIAPDAKYSSDISVDQPENPGGDYTVRYSLSYTVKGPTYGTGATISSPEIASRTVGTSNTRAGVTELVETALEEVREFGDFFARKGRSEPLPTDELTSPREDRPDTIRDHTQEFLPRGVTRESIKQDAAGANFNIPTELTDVDGIGPARAGEFEDAGIRDVVDVMALLATVKPAFWVETLVRELPDDPKGNIREAAGDLWGNFVWPSRELPGNLDKDLPDEQIAIGDETEPEGASLPDNIESGRWDAYAVARPENDFRDRFEAVVLSEGDRKKPELEIPDESLESFEDNVQSDLTAWMFESGDVVAAAAFSEDARGPPRQAASNYEPGMDVLERRTTDESGNLTVTADDGWTGIPPRALREASEGDLQRGWTTAPIIDPAPEGRGYGTVVGWEDYPDSKQYVYNDLASTPYFVYRLNVETDQLEGLGSSGDPGTRHHVAIYRKPTGDGIIGLDPDTEAGPEPAEPVLRSEYEDEYDLFPFFRSQDAVSELIGETVLLRGSGGMIREGEVTGETRGGAGVTIDDTVIPDGRYYIPASSEHEDSTAQIIGKPVESDGGNERLNVEGWEYRMTDDGADAWKGAYPTPGYDGSENTLVVVERAGLNESEYGVVVYPFDADAEELGSGILQESEVVKTYKTREEARRNAMSLAEIIRDGDAEPDYVDDGDETEPEPEPDDEPADLPFETAITEFSDANLQETAWSHIERDLGANPEILFLNDDRTLGIHGERVELSDQDIFEAVGIRFSEPVPEGEVRDLRSETAENSTVVGSNTDIFEFALGIIQENPPEAVREQLDEKTGTGEEEVSETLSKLATALADADNLLDRARNVGAMGAQELQRIQRSVQELERAVDNLEQVPMSSDVEDANETIERFRNREEDAEEVIESASGSPDEGGDGELTQAEVETIVENATEGVAVNAPFPAGNLSEIQMRSVGDFDIPDRITAGTTADTPREAVRVAVERWEEAVDLSKVDAERANKAREALNRQFSLDLPLIEVEESEPEPESDPDEEAGIDPDGDIVAQLEDEFARELGGMGLPSRPRPPADFVVEEDMGRISARPNVPAEWEPVLQDQPGVVTGSIDDPDGFLADYLERLFQAIDFSKVDAAAINKKRARLNERFGLDLPVLNAQGEPQAGTEAGEDTGTEETGGEAASQRVEPLRVQGGVYIVPDDVPAGAAEEARNQAEAALGPADQFDNNTRVGDAIIQDGQVAVRVEEGERILDARRQQEDLEERTPDFDMDAPLTAETVREAFPRMLGNGKAFADEFDTLGEMVNAPLSRLESIYGVGMGTIKRFIDNPEPEMDASIMDQRRRPLGIEDDVPDDSPMPEIKTDEEVEDVPEGTTGGVPEVAVSIPPTAPRGEKWMAQQIQRGNRIQPNKYDENPIVEIVFPERISGQVRNVVAQYDISRGGQTVSVQNPSFRDELPEEAAALKSIQFLLSGGGVQPASDLRSSGYDIQQIINDLSDRLIIVTRSPVVRAPITFPN